jgi:hypothetical protein
MGYIAGDEKGLAGADFEAASRVLEDETTVDDVYHLFVRVTVTDADPAFAHGMSYEHHGGAVGHDLTT